MDKEQKRKCGQFRDTFGNLLPSLLAAGDFKNKNVVGWTNDFDVNIIESLMYHSNGETFQLTSREFVDLLFKLPKPLLNRIFSLPQNEMFKLIYYYWKQLNDERLGRIPSQYSFYVRGGKDKKRGRGHDHLEKDRSSKTNPIFKLTTLKVFPPRGLSQDSKTTDVVSPTWTESEEDDFDVVHSRAQSDVVPFRRSPSRWSFGPIGAFWNWFRIGLQLRRSRRVVPIDGDTLV